MSQNQYEELPMYEPSNEPPKGILKKKKAPETSTSSANVGMDELKDGQYNEAESHESFLEALNAWRTAGKKQKPTTQPSNTKMKGKVDFNDV